MKTLFAAETISRGGRSGTIRTPDGLLDGTLGNPLEKGIEKRGPNWGQPGIFSPQRPKQI